LGSEVELVIEFLQKLWNSIVAPALPLLLAFLGYWLGARQERISKSYERHSDDLRKLAHDWSIQLNPISEAGNPLGQEPSKLLLPVETQLLFSDLKNHLPKGLQIIEPWERFKNHLLDYDRRGFRLYQEIVDEAKEKTVLPYDPSSSDAPTIGYAFGRRWYSEVFTVVTRPKFSAHEIDIRVESAGSNNFEVKSQGEILARVHGESEATAVERVLREMFSALPDSLYIKQAREILEMREHLEEERFALLLMIDDFALIPLVKGGCKYIRWSTWRP